MTLFADSDFMNLDVNCPISNMQVSLYRVADENYKLVDAFSHYSIDLKQDAQGAANALENRILMDGIEADASNSSDSSYKASFTGLESGIYLVVGKEVESNGVVAVFRQDRNARNGANARRLARVLLYLVVEHDLVIALGE